MVAAVYDIRDSKNLKMLAVGQGNKIASDYATPSGDFNAPASTCLRAKRQRLIGEPAHHENVIARYETVDIDAEPAINGARRDRQVRSVQ